MWIKTKAPRPLVISLLLAWWLACWLATGVWFDDEANEAYRIGSLNAERFIADAVPGYNRILRTHSGVPRVLARDPDIRRALARFGPEPPPPPADEEERRRRWSAEPDLAQINSFLEVSARELGFDALVLLNANGDCVAASNAGSARSIVGASYGNRDDFQSARAGRSGYLASAGKRMGSTGVSFYAPVIDHGRFIGVVTGGNALAPFVNLLDQADAFLSDRNGVVLLARDPSIMLHSLPGAPVSRLDTAVRQALYQRTELTPLDFSSWGNKRFPELLRVPGRVAPAILRSGSVADGGLTVSVLWPMPQLVVLTQQRLVYAGALGVIGTLLLLLAAVYVTRRRERSVMALALAEREQTAMDSRNFLDQIVNAIADPIFVKDREHRWVLVNQAFCSIFGQPREHFIGKSAPDVFPEREARRLRDTDERVLTSGTECINEEKLTDGHGITHIVVIKKAPYTDAYGKQFLVGVLSDISERKQVERLLRAREREFSSLAENLPVAVIRYDSECRRRYLNPSAEKMLHGSPPELLGHEPGGPTVPATPAMIAHYRGKMEEVLATDTMRELDFVLDALPADSQEHYEVRFVPEHGLDGKTVGVVAIWYDITELKRLESKLTQREAAFRSLAENLLDNIARWDIQGRYLYVNPTHARVLGAALSELIGQPIPDTHEHVKAAIAQVVTTGQVVMLVRQSAVVDGETQIHDVSLAPEFDGAGHVVSVLGIGRDMTDIYRLQDSLVAREQEFRSLAESSPDFIVRLDLDGRCRYLNARVLGFLELASAQEVIGKRPGDVYPDGRLEAFEQAALRVAKSGNQESIELFVPGESGTATCHQIGIVPERDATGQIVGAIAFGREITAIREAERQRAHFIDNLPGLVFTFHVAPDGHGCFPYVSPAIGEIYGLKPEDVKNDMAPLHAMAHPDDQPRIEAAIAESGRTMTPFRIESRVRRPGHPERWLDMRSVPEHQPDGSILWYGLMLDISERKRLETELVQRENGFRSLVENSPDTIIRYDRECRRIYCNPAQAQASGMPNAELLGKTTEECSPFPADVARAYTTLVRQVFDNAQTREMELNWERNGAPACLHMRVNPEFDGEGRVVSALAIGRDISLLKQAETHLRKSRDVLRALAVHQETEHEKTRQELAFQIHEDLAQNLTALRMNISLFEMSGDAALCAPLLKTMSAIAERSIVRIRDIVSMLRPTVLDLGLVPALQWLTDDFKGVGFKFDLALQEDILLHDETAIFLFRVAQEALINVALHAAATHIQLSLDCVAGVCRLVVRDNGCGFDPAAPRREGSFRLYGLVEQARHHGGDLVIDSACGQGTALAVQMPAFRTATPHLLPHFSGATPT